MAFQSVWYFTDLPEDIVDIIERDVSETFDEQMAVQSRKPQRFCVLRDCEPVYCCLNISITGSPATVAVIRCHPRNVDTANA